MPIRQLQKRYIFSYDPYTLQSLVYLPSWIKLLGIVRLWCISVNVGIWEPSYERGGDEGKEGGTYLRCSDFSIDANRVICPPTAMIHYCSYLLYRRRQCGKGAYVGLFFWGGGSRNGQ